MLHLITGRANVSKTEYLMNITEDAVLNGIDCIFILPEQYSVAGEKALLRRFSDKINMHAEVLNFQRLPERIRREYGRGQKECADSTFEIFAMATATQRLLKSGELEFFASAVNDTDFLKKMISTCKKLTADGITPEMQSEAVKKLLPCDSVSKKLSDTAKIMCEYEKIIAENSADAAAESAVLARECDEMPFFEGKYVFIDGFYNFTGNEHRLIDKIIEQASETYITVAGDTDEEIEFFSENIKSALGIKKRHEKCEIIKAKKPVNRAESLVILEKNLWEPLKCTDKNEPDGVEIIECKNAFDQAEAVCAKIYEYVKKGSRFREIAVVTPEQGAQTELIAAAAKEHGIPMYASVKRSAASFPFFSFIIAALEAVRGDFSVNSVKKYVKSGFAGIDLRRGDEFCDYISDRKIYGRRRYEKPWLMNPNGFIAEMTPAAQMKLLGINNVRNRIYEDTAVLFEDLHRENLTFSEACEAIFNFVREKKANELLKKQAESLRKDGNENQAAEQIRLWNIFVGICEQINKSAGAEKTDCNRFCELFKAAAQEKQVGTIPTISDAVTVSTPEMFRQDGFLHVIVTSVNEGMFPKAPSESGIFDFDESLTLEEQGIMTDADFNAQINENMFMFYAVCTAPERSLTLIYPQKALDGAEINPSFGITDIESIFPGLEKKVFPYGTESYCFSEKCAERNHLLRENPRIRKELEKKGKFSNKNESFDFTKAQISNQSGTIFLSSSSADTYAKCPFKYFSQNILKLSAPPEAGLSMRQTGVLVHEILEKFIKSRVVDGKFIVPDDDERIRETDEICNKFIEERANGDELVLTRRFLYQLGKIKKSVYAITDNLCREFSVSEFVPEAFELKVGMGDEGISGPFFDTAFGKVGISGIIDRADILHKGNTDYVRIADYKTGKLPDDAKEAEQGLNMQMFYYLFALCDSMNKENEAKHNGKKAVPAGAIYVPTFPESGKFTRKGYVTDNIEVLNAMDPEAQGKFLPVKLNAHGTQIPKSAKCFMSDEDFECKKEKLRDYLISLGESIASGYMNPEPLVIEDGRAPCDFCDYKMFCRNSLNTECRRSVNRLYNKESAEEDEKNV